MSDPGFTLPLAEPEPEPVPELAPEPESAVPPPLPVMPILPVEPPPPPPPVIEIPRSPRSPEPVGPSGPPRPEDTGIAVAERSRDVGLDLDRILVTMLESGGSDLHLSVKSPPMIRVHGDLEPLAGFGPLTPMQVQESIYGLLTERQKRRFEEDRELDFAYELPGAARFRVNLMAQQGRLGAVFRAIPWEILPLEALGMPATVGDFALLPRGLVLVTGPTGSGKSTTLAAIIDRANRQRAGHIVTIEDPIEFVHQHRRSLVSQREVGVDTLSFDAALKHALRQDPDIILVGEMRDYETIAIALTAAETGHLVFGTLHTSSAASTIDRVIDVFPAERQAQVRTQLAGSLKAVVCQVLCRTSDGNGRVAATEVMIATPAIMNLIREGKLQSIPSSLQTGSRFGMHTLNQDLARLVQEGRITYDTATEKASDLFELRQLLGVSTDAPD